MANKGCNNCLHYKIGEMKMWEDDIPSKCLLGKEEKFRLWWEENGRKRNTDEIWIASKKRNSVNFVMKQADY